MVKQKSWFSVVIFLAVIVVVNMIASNISGRFDLTENNVYTMSKVTKTVLESIDEPVTVKIYHSEKFPKQLLDVKQYVLDLLQEYKHYAGSGLEYEFYEIGEGSEEIKQEAHSYGISPVQANIQENDQFKVQQIYLGVAFLYGDKKEALPFIQQIEQLEYDFTGAIKRLTQGGKVKIAYFTGHDEISVTPENPYASMMQQQKKDASIKNLLTELNTQYELEEINLTEVEKIPAHLSVGILLEPKKSFDEKSKYLLDQFMMRGGKLAIYINRHKIDLQNQFLPVMPLQYGLEDFFKSYGFDIKDNIVIDKNAARVQMMQQVGPLKLPVSVDFPFAPRFAKYNTENPVTSRANDLVFFFSSSIDSVSKKGLTFTPLIQTSEQSGFAMKDPQRGMYNINPQQQFFYNQKHLAVGALVEGAFTSHFSATPDTVTYPDPHLSEAQGTPKIMVFSDADFIKDDYAGEPGINFFMNSIDWLYDENGLISIRNKKVEIRPLDKEIMAEDAIGTRNFLKLMNVLLAPILIILFGIMKWVIRRRTKQMAMVN